MVVMGEDLTPAQRSLRARVAAHTSWASTSDRAARTAAARKAANDRFARQVDPEGALSLHTLAHEWRLNGGDPDDLMAITGWESREVLRVYGESAAAVRAEASHRKLGLGNRV
jgi:hypothetical protein